MLDTDGNVNDAVAGLTNGKGSCYVGIGKFGRTHNRTNGKVKLGRAGLLSASVAVFMCIPRK